MILPKVPCILTIAIISFFAGTVCVDVQQHDSAKVSVDSRKWRDIVKLYIEMCEYLTVSKPLSDRVRRIPAEVL